MRAKIGDVVIDKTYNKKGNLAIVVGEGISQPILIDHNGGIARDKLRDYFAVWDGLEVIGHIDLERIWEEAVRKADRKTEPQKKYPTEWCEDCNLWREDNCMGVAQCKANMEAVMKIYEASKDEPQTTDYCDVCNHKGCENCVADNSNPYCVPSNYEPQTD